MQRLSMYTDTSTHITRCVIIFMQILNSLKCGSVQFNNKFISAIAHLGIRAYTNRHMYFLIISEIFRKTYVRNIGCEVCAPALLKHSGKIPNIFHSEMKIKRINDSSKSNTRTLALWFCLCFPHSICPINHINNKARSQLILRIKIYWNLV